MQARTRVNMLSLRTGSWTFYLACWNIDHFSLSVFMLNFLTDKICWAFEGGFVEQLIKHQLISKYPRIVKGINARAFKSEQVAIANKHLGNWFVLMKYWFYNLSIFMPNYLTDDICLAFECGFVKHLIKHQLISKHPRRVTCINACVF